MSFWKAILFPSAVALSPETPPGHWCLFAQFVSKRDHHSTEEDIKLFFALTNAGLDASIVAWDAKRAFDSIRPVSAISYLFHGQQIRAWGGSGKGTVTMDGADWIPYQPATLPTPPFPEYVSGHSTFSAAAAAILRLFTGCDDFGDSVDVSGGKFVHRTWHHAGEASASRVAHLYGGGGSGRHIAALNGAFTSDRQTGTDAWREDKVGELAWNKAKSLWNGVD